MATPKRLELESRGTEMRRRLKKCWKTDIDWALYPKHLREVCNCMIS